MVLAASVLSLVVVMSLREGGSSVRIPMPQDFHEKLGSILIGWGFGWVEAPKP